MYVINKLLSYIFKNNSHKTEPNFVPVTAIVNYLYVSAVIHEVRNAYFFNCALTTAKLSFFLA